MNDCCPECGFDLHADRPAVVATIATAPETFVHAWRRADGGSPSMFETPGDGWSPADHARHLIRALDWTRRELLERRAGDVELVGPFLDDEVPDVVDARSAEEILAELESAAAWLVRMVPLLARSARPTDEGALLRTAAHEVSHHCCLVSGPIALRG